MLGYTKTHIITLIRPMVGWSGLINCHYGCVAVGVGDLNDQNHVGVGELINYIKTSISLDGVGVGDWKMHPVLSRGVGTIPQ